jgi:3-hydroxyisobutyrate dehydrogenase-like beta-hydroxyacid dehydrogenase
VAAGAVHGGSPREIADQAEIIFICVPNNDSITEVMLGDDGVINGRAVKLVVNLGTTGSAYSRDMTAKLAEKSIVMLDAPISGGALGAAKATLAIMVSGPHAAFERIEPMLQMMGKSITFVGETVGAAQTLKLANNLLSATAFAITTEAMVMGAKAGLDPAMMLEVINAGSGRNSATADKFPRIVLPRTFNLGATFDTMFKDVKLCVAEAKDLGVPMSVGVAVGQLFKNGLDEYGGGADFTYLVEQVEKLAGTQIPKVG